MASSFPVGAWGVCVPPNEDALGCLDDESEPQTVHITMAAIDPGEKWETNQGIEKDMKQRATLKMIVMHPPEPSIDGEESDSDIYDEEEDESESDDELNGGPSNPKKKTLGKQLSDAKDAITKKLSGGDSMDVDGIDDAAEVKGKGKSKAKAKAKATELPSDESDVSDDDEDADNVDIEEFVVCTLDPNSHYQQPLDITVTTNDLVQFGVNGTHKIYLTGNIVVSPHDRGLEPSDYSSDEEDEDMTMAGAGSDSEEEGLDMMGASDSESDELDDTDDPRITELASEDEAQVPKLVKVVPGETKKEKGKNKRPFLDSDEPTPEKPPASSDSILAKSLKPDNTSSTDGTTSTATLNGDQADLSHLSKSQRKKQRKKMKDNAGNAVEVQDALSTQQEPKEDEDKGIKQEQPNGVNKSSPAGKPDKKVQFAKTLVQGPSGGANPDPSSAMAENKTKVVQQQVNGEKPKDDTKQPKPSLGVKNIQGVTVDDRKIGAGPQAKKGDKVSMRYIGKLESNKRVFDSNKKGTPFSFTLGSGQVIRGWDVGVTGMQVGGERRITVPPGLAYGKESKGGNTIPANSTLVFDLKVLKID
ncbi:MAG: peptidylprolyl isomerase fpr4 [Alyxoria varia]|nr:MAG: peptidylprolyl isomerase fpr4 [Alyxoria varia]